MKKNLTFLTGIVFVITILIAGACGSAPENDSQTFADPAVETDPIVQTVPEEVDTVIIYLVEAFEENGTKHLRMYDSHYPENRVVDNLETFVWPGTVVIWVALNDSGIKKLKKISPKDSNSNRNIMHKDAAGFFYTLFTGKKKHIVPDNAPRPSEIEGYLIKFKHEDGGSPWEIDPYLKIPPQDPPG